MTLTKKLYLNIINNILTQDLEIEMQYFIRERIIHYITQKKKSELDSFAATLDLSKWQKNLDLAKNNNRLDLVQYAEMRIKHHENNLKSANQRIKECKIEINRLKEQVNSNKNTPISSIKEDSLEIVLEGEIIDENEVIKINDEELEDLRLLKSSSFILDI